MNKYSNDINTKIKMEKMIKNALVKNKPPEANFTHFTDQTGANMDLKNLNYKLQMSKMLGEAMQSDNSIPKKVTSHVTDEMIKEYKDELNKPIVVTDEHGNEHSYKYHPASTIPNLDAYPPLDDVPDERALSAEMKIVLEEFDKEKSKIDTIIKHIQTIVNKINSINPQSREEMRGRGRLFLEKANLEAQIPVIEANITVLEANIAALQHEISTIPAIIADNQAKTSKVDADNKLKIDDFVNEMNVLNSGQFNTDKYANETDIEYLDRLKQNAQTPNDNSYLEVEAEIYNIKKFKENMKHLISSDSNIESILKNLDTDEIFNINSVFNIIKEQFLKVFGYNNKNVKVNEIRDFLLNIAYQKNALLSGNVSKQVQMITALSAGIQYPVVPDEQMTKDIITTNENNACIFRNVNDGREFYAKLGIVSIKEIIVMASDNGNIGTYKNVQYTNNKTDPRNFKVLLENIGFTPTEIKNYFGTNDMSQNVEAFLVHRKLIPENITSHSKEKKGAPNVYGMGLHLEKIPKFCQFGKIFIKLDKLFYKNILAVKDQNKFNIHGFKDCPVSDEFVELIMKMC